MSKLHVAESDKFNWSHALMPDINLCEVQTGYQSIDEPVTKFKVRCSFKQCLPLKPVIRGIKLWIRRDPRSGYTCDANIYAGEDGDGQSGPLGDKVVKTLVSTIHDGEDATLAFDRLFTSVHLKDTIRYPAVGTAINTWKNLPVFREKVSRADSEFRWNMNGTLAVRWMDTKEVLVLSNFHTNTIGEVRKKQRDGSIINAACPDAIQSYRHVMGGGDGADQMADV